MNTSRGDTGARCFFTISENMGQLFPASLEPQCWKTASAANHKSPICELCKQLSSSIKCYVKVCKGPISHKTCNMCVVMMIRARLYWCSPTGSSTSISKQGVGNNARKVASKPGGVDKDARKVAPQPK
jgi:hypothetical protein